MSSSQERSTQPSSHENKPWVIMIVIIATSLVALLAAMPLYMILPLVPVLSEKLRTSHSVIGWITSTFGFGYAIGFLVFGPLSDRLGRKPVMILGLFALAAMSAANAFAMNVSILILLRFFQGVAAGTYPPVVIAYVVESVPERWRALSVSSLGTAWISAGIIGQLYGGTFGKTGDLMLLFLPLVAVYVVFALLFIPLLQPGKKRAKQHPTEKTGLFHSLSQVFRNAVLLKAYLAAFFVFFSFVVFYASESVYLSGWLLKNGHNPMHFRLAGIPGMLLPLVMPRVIKRWGPLLLFRTGLIVSAVGLGIACCESHFPALILGCGILVAGIGMTLPGLIAHVSVSAEERTRGLAVSIYTFLLFVGASVAPLVVSAVYEAGINWSLLMGAIAGALFVVSFLNRPWRTAHTMSEPLHGVRS